MGVLSTALRIFISVLTWLVVARILLSWFRPRSRNRGNSWFFTIDELLWRATEPLLAPIRNLLPMGGGMGVDFSPMILLLLVRWVGGFLIQMLVSAGL